MDLSLKTEMMAPIAISDIREENLPQILTAILGELTILKRAGVTNMDDHEELKTILKEHEECLQIFKFSKCNLIPWISRNKYIVAMILLAISSWQALVDWLIRWAQWTFYPPRIGP